MRLGVIFEPKSANAYYRATIPLRSLERRGHKVVWPTRPDFVPLREFSTCDLVHCYRRTDRLEDLRKLSARGVAVSFDNDDDFATADLSKGSEGFERHRYYKQVHREMMQAARLADLTTTPSALLAERYRAAGIDNVAIVENRLERDTFGFGSRSRHDGVVVGWVAGREHEFDLERVPIVNALERLLDAHANLRVLTVGLRLPLRSERYEHVPRVDFPNLLKAISTVDIGIAPLADTAFNRARSNVKLKEYGSVGAMWLASPVGPYRNVGEREGGSLVGEEDWFSTIDALIRNGFRRRRLARRALRWAKSQTIDHFSSTWEELFLEAITRAEHRRSRQVGPPRSGIPHSDIPQSR